MKCERWSAAEVPTSLFITAAADTFRTTSRQVGVGCCCEQVAAAHYSGVGENGANMKTGKRELLLNNKTVKWNNKFLISASERRVLLLLEFFLSALSVTFSYSDLSPRTSQIPLCPPSVRVEREVTKVIVKCYAPTLRMDQSSNVRAMRPPRPRGDDYVRGRHNPLPRDSNQNLVCPYTAGLDYTNTRCRNKLYFVVDLLQEAHVARTIQ